MLGLVMVVSLAFDLHTTFTGYSYMFTRSYLASYGRAATLYGCTCTSLLSSIPGVKQPLASYVFLLVCALGDWETISTFNSLENVTLATWLAASGL